MSVEFNKLLRRMGACKEAIDWVADRDLASAWAECHQGAWMIWLPARMLGHPGWPTKQEVVRTTVHCVEPLLPIYERRYPGDTRPGDLIRAMLAWCDGKETLQNVERAASAAYAASAAAYADSRITYDAGCAAYAASPSDAAAYCAGYAAYAIYCSAAAAHAAACAAHASYAIDCGASTAAVAARVARAAYAPAYAPAAAAAAEEEFSAEVAELVRKELKIPTVVSELPADRAERIING